MSFREALLAKIDIKHLAGKVEASIDPSDGTHRIDRDSMRLLVEKGGFARVEERDLELYLLEPDAVPPRILVLDNELTIYNTTVEDVALRKSPTVKEMVNIRNAIRILNDGDVVVSKKADTVRTVAESCIGQLDLAYTAADIEALRSEAVAALENRYADGVQEGLLLFCDLLGYRPAPPALRIAHHDIVAPLDRGRAAGTRFGPPVILNDRSHNRICLVDRALDPAKKADREYLRQLSDGEVEPRCDGGEVFGELASRVPAAPA